MSTGAELIAAERARQVEVEGYTAAHDAHHEPWEFGMAAAAYLLGVGAGVWPWGMGSFKREAFGNDDPTVRDLIKAGALIAAAIDAIAAMSPEATKGGGES